MPDEKILDVPELAQKKLEGMGTREECLECYISRSSCSGSSLGQQYNAWQMTFQPKMEVNSRLTGTDCLAR